MVDGDDFQAFFTILLTEIFQAGEGGFAEGAFVGPPAIEGDLAGDVEGLVGFGVQPAVESEGGIFWPTSCWPPRDGEGLDGGDAQAADGEGEDGEVKLHGHHCAMERMICQSETRSRQWFYADHFISDGAGCGGNREWC